MKGTIGLTRRPTSPKSSSTSPIKRLSWSRVSEFLSYLLMSVFLSLVLFALVAPYFFGFTLLNVMGGSMNPAIPAGSVAVVQPFAASKIKVGDIIAYQLEKEQSSPVAHRVVEVFSQRGSISFQTRGDNNLEADKSLVPSTGVIGKVRFHIPLLGFLLYFVKQPLGYGLLIGLPALTIIIIEIKSIARQKSSLKKRKQQEVT